MSQESMQIDTTTNGKVVDGEDEEMKEEEEEIKKNLGLDLLIMVKSAQNQNGLRHNDYSRYHKYCIRKIYRIRKSLKFTQGKKQFVKKQVTPTEALKNPKHLMLLIFKCEANWAYGMKERQIISNESQAKQQRNPNRVKFSAKKRFQKAYDTAQYLIQVAKESVDPYQEVEIEAYASQIMAVYLMEVRKFEEALNHLIKSKIIYDKISQYKDTLEAIIYKEKIGQLDTLIRQCSFFLQGMVNADQESKYINSLIQNYPKKKEIEEQVQKVKFETKKEQIEKLDEITYGNKTVPLKTERLREVFKRVESHMQMIQEYWEASNFEHGQQISKAQIFDQPNIENYLQLVNILEDAALIIKKEKSEESKRSEQSGQLYNILINYTQKLKLQSSIERNLLQAKALAKKINLDTLFSNTKLKSELRPQNIVRFYEKVLKSQRSIINMEKDQLDPFKQLEYEFYYKLYNTQIKYYIGLHYSNEKSYQDAFLILHKVSGDIEQTVEFAQKNQLQSVKVKRDLQDLQENMFKNINYLLCQCHAKVLQAQQEQFQKMQDELSQLQINTNQDQSTQKRHVEFDNLYDVLFTDSGNAKQNLTKKLLIKSDHMDFLENQGQNIQIVDNVGSRKTIEVDKLKISKQFKFVNPIPKFQSVPATPQFFDLAGTNIQYPNLEEALGKYKPSGAQGGLLKKLTGFFGR